MPTYIELQNLIIPKSIIEFKYKGGIKQFRKWYNDNKGAKWQEDNETFSIARMNSVDDDIIHFVKMGMSFDDTTKYSDDFCVISRYEGLLWEVDWLEYNAVFAWHKDCDKEKMQQVKSIATMTMDEIEIAFDRGEQPWNTIW